MEKLFDTTDFGVARFLHYHDKGSYRGYEVLNQDGKEIRKWYFAKYNKQMTLLHYWLDSGRELMEEGETSN